MQFGEADERLGGATRFTAALLPLFQRALRDTEKSGEPLLREAGTQPRADHRRAGFHSSPLAPAGLDLADGVQDFLPNVAARLESGERASCEFLCHLRNH